MSASVRIRHGVIADPLLGYRAIRQIGDRRNWIGPWHAIEDDAQADINTAREHLMEAAQGGGVEIRHNPNPDIGTWQPAGPLPEDP